MLDFSDDGLPPSEFALGKIEEVEGYTWQIKVTKEVAFAQAYLDASNVYQLAIDLNLAKQAGDGIYTFEYQVI